MNNEGSATPIKSPIAKVVKEALVSIETTFGDKNFIEVSISEDKKLIFVVQETSNNNYVISKILTYLFLNAEFEKDNSKSTWQYIEGVNICEAIKSYCINKLSLKPREVFVQVDVTDEMSCLNKIH